MDNKRIKVTELDFDQIKSNLKNFFAGQSQYSDWDFEGSGLSVLIDVLAYNTHYNALYANLAMNEAFLDSAAKRNSVVSHAKLLGYTPSSAKSAQAVVNLRVTNVTGSPDTLTLPANSQFSTSISGTTYTFYNRNAMTVGITAGTRYEFNNLIITEGTPLRNRYVAAAGTRFIIPNVNCDLSTLTVQVQDSVSTAAYKNFTMAPEFSLIKSTDNVFFVKEIENQLYEVYFGDGIIGTAIAPGNVVTLNYFVSSQDAANNALVFTFDGDIGGSYVTTTVTKAQGGSAIESIDSIKLHAPRNYSAQNRAVTANDYKTLLPQLYPNIKTVSVWGGDEQIPPDYGKVYISIKPKSGETLTTATKELISKSLLRTKNLVSIIPVIIDPEYLYISILSNVYFNPLATEKNAATIKALVTNTINSYNDDELEQFGARFRFSRLTKLIDETDTGVTSNITNIRMTKKFTPYFDNLTTYTINFANPIYNQGVPEQAVISSGFYVAGISDLVYLDDDGLGKLRLFSLGSSGAKIFVLPGVDIGTIDYENGIVKLTDKFSITGLASTDTQISIHCVPDSMDILSVRNQLVVINKSAVNVNVLVDTVASGQYSGGSNFVFTSSHNYTV